MKANLFAVKQAVRDRLVELVDWTIDYEELMGVQVGVIVDAYLDLYFEHDQTRYDTIAVEQEIVSDVVNPETGRPSTIFDHASKQDALAIDTFTNETVVIEHKTTSDDLAPDSFYWRKLSIDSQITKYILSARQDGMISVRTCLYDVCSKPTTKPKRVVAKEVREIVESGCYFGYEVSPETLYYVRNEYESNKGAKGGFTGKLDETIELYGLRLRRLIADDPTRFFGRQEITRTDDEIEQYAKELWALTGEIRKARRSPVAPRNTSACWSFSSPCEYFGICCGEAVDQGQFVQTKRVHVELETEFEDSGKDIITNSRISTFMTCREKHRLRYEEGLRKVTLEEAEYLKWGTLFHKLLEVVWESYKVRKGELCLIG